MTFLPPDALATDGDATALGHLGAYFGTPYCGPGAYGGAHFDQWDSRGTRDANADRFTADDLVAVTFLSVSVSPPAARAILRDRADELAGLLREVGEDRDLADEPERHPDDWAGWRLMAALRTLPKVGPTTASKLVARKRPRLRPIWDSVVSELTGTEHSQWEPVRVALRADDRTLHRRLLRIRTASGLPEQVSVLRVLEAKNWPWALALARAFTRLRLIPLPN